VDVEGAAGRRTVLAVDLQFVEVPDRSGFAEAFAAIMGERADTFVFPDPLTSATENRS